MLLNFLRDPRGSVLPIFAIAAIPLVVATGAVVDYTNAYDQRGLVQDAMDAAALAAGKQVGLMTTDELKAEAENFYLANVGVGKITNIPTLETSIEGSTVDVTTELHVPTYFLGLIGLNEFIFNLRTQVTIAMGTLEVVMVLDNSTSMCLSCSAADQNSPTTKIGTLKTAATGLVNTLYGLGATSTKPEPVKIGLAPFAGSVNVGPGVDWVDKLGNGTNAGQAIKAESGGAVTSFNPYTQFATLQYSNGNPVTWAGCVEERPMPYAVDDTPPSLAANPTSDEKKTLFVPMFAPDESDAWTCGTGTCLNAGTGTSNRRYNGVPSTSSVSFNNYLPDVGSAAACGPGVTTTIANPAVLTSNNHGLAADNEIAFQTTGSLPTGLSTASMYYAVPGPNVNTFYVSAASTTTVTVGSGTSQTFTVTSASPAVFTRSSHGLTAGTAIQLSTTGSMYSPLTAGSTYYVISSGLSSSNFRVSTTSGGSAVNTSGSQSGTHSYVREALFTKSSHGLSVGDAVMFTTTGSLPTGISANTVYYVRLVPSSSTFTISATSGGGPIFPGSSQSGTHSFHKLIATSGSQSGTHTYTAAAQWTCQSDNSNCGGTNNGRSANLALAGANISGQALCKYGTVANKAVIPATFTVNSIKGGPNYMCTTTAVTPLTTAQQTVIDAINAQEANGYTNITSGIMWGWRMLSPTAPFTEGRSNDDNENQKILIVMTDGENTYQPYMQASSNPSSSTAAGKFIKSSYGAWGYLYSNNIGTTSTQSATVFTNLNARTAAACENAKTDGIRIYTIAFQVTDTATVNMLKNCASDPTMAFKSDNNAALIAAFNAIGDDLSLLRIAM